MDPLTAVLLLALAAGGIGFSALNDQPETQSYIDSSIRSELSLTRSKLSGVIHNDGKKSISDLYVTVYFCKEHFDAAHKACSNHPVYSKTFALIKSSWLFESDPPLPPENELDVDEKIAMPAYLKYEASAVYVSGIAFQSDK